MTSPIFASPNLTLADLTMLARQQEQILGPLVLIGNDGAKTLLGFDQDRDPPINAIEINRAESQAPAGASVVGTGVCFISGTLTPVVCYRQM